MASHADDYYMIALKKIAVNDLSVKMSSNPNIKHIMVWIKQYVPVLGLNTRKVHIRIRNWLLK